ncbi:MAG: hypothetical protein ACREJD_05790 [Phycisphaerales bacterium]
MMLTFTIDPTLFASPREAFKYLSDNRCLSKTMQDLRRGGWLASNRWFAVIEWQKTTEQVHFHVLVDSRYIPYHEVARLWGKNRPATAGPVAAGRPDFGTVRFTVQRGGFTGPYHAACYATKYLVKFPDQGFPTWALDMGRDRRVRRYSTSRGFWGETREREEPRTTRKPTRETYRVRVAACAQTCNVFERSERVEFSSGEVVACLRWIGQVTVQGETLETFDDGDDPRRRRRVIHAGNLNRLESVLTRLAGHSVKWIRGGRNVSGARQKRVEGSVTTTEGVAV